MGMAEAPRVRESEARKAARLLALWRLLIATTRGLSVAEIAERLGVPVRTALRDLADLQEPPLSVPLWRDGGRWGLRPEGILQWRRQWRVDG